MAASASSWCLPTLNQSLEIPGLPHTEQNAGERAKTSLQTLDRGSAPVLTVLWPLSSMLSLNPGAIGWVKKLALSKATLAG